MISAALGLVAPDLQTRSRWRESAAACACRAPARRRRDPADWRGGSRRAASGRACRRAHGVSTPLVFLPPSKPVSCGLRPLFRRLDRLAVDDRRTGLGRAVLRLAQGRVERLMDAMEKNMPRRSATGQNTPRPCCAAESPWEDAATDSWSRRKARLAEPRAHRPRVAAAALRGRDVRLDQRPLRIAQIARVAQHPPIISPAIFPTPPDASMLPGVGHRSQTTPESRVSGQALTPAGNRVRKPFANALVGRKPLL